MPSGLLIDFNDGYRMEITAGLRAPFFCRTTVQGYNGKSVPVDGYGAGDVAVFIPTESVRIFDFGTALFPYTQRLVSVTQSGGTLTMNSQGDREGASDTYQWPGQVWRITPASQSGNSGLLISDSTDFTALTTNGNLGSCTWYGTVTINGAWTPPVTGIVFASWDSPTAVLENIGGTLYCSSDSGAYEDMPASVTARIAIFSNDAPVPGPGLTFINAQGLCTFSTTRKPFVIKSFFTPSLSWQAVAGMVPVGRYGWEVRRAENSTSWNVGRGRGLMMSGGNVKGGRGRVVTRNDRQKWDFDSSGMSAMSLPVIPSMY
ncbi:DUF6453 family protein [Kosakonia cowanii]|uniref:DUF6453 family protein n=1 Tax=Kosakonia cowanii TaxID=208223 RepID=UPI003EEB0B85